VVFTWKACLRKTALSAKVAGGHWKRRDWECNENLQLGVWVRRNCQYLRRAVEVVCLSYNSPKVGRIVSNDLRFGRFSIKEKQKPKVL
jgi:hypothetical protein